MATTSEPAAGHEQGLQARAIGFWGALAMSVAAMGPLLGALGVAPLIVGEAGFSAPFIFVICWIAMVAVALTIGRFTRLLPGAASIYSYVAHGLGERLGFLTGWLSFSYYVLFVPLLMTAFGIYAEAAAADVFGISVTWWIWSLLGMAIVFGLAMTGIALSMRIDLALAVIADGFLLLVSAVIIAKVIGDGAFTLEPLAPTNAPGDFTGLSLAIAFGVLIFLGFEQSFVLGEETTDPKGNVPKAIYTSLALVGFVLFLSTFALVLGFGERGMVRLGDLLASEGTPWFALVRERIGSGWVDVLQVMIVFSILSNTIASTNSVTRIQYGMGRAHALPRQFGWTRARERTPYVAIIVTTAVAVAITLIPGLVWSPVATFAFLGFGVGFAAAVSFILINIAALWYAPRAGDGAPAWRSYAVPVVAIVILIPVVYTSFYPSPGYPLKWAPWVAIGWLALGVVYLLWREHRHERIDVDYTFGEGRGEPPAPTTPTPA